MDEPLLSEAEEPSTSIYGRPHQSFTTPALLIILLLITIVISLVAQLLPNSFSATGQYVIYSIATLTGTSFISGGTCFLALKLILRPCCHSRHNNEMGVLVDTLFAQYIFSQDVIDNFMREKTENLTLPDAIESHVTPILESIEFSSLIDDTIDNFFRSPIGSNFEALGMSREMIRPFVKRAIDRIVLSNCVDFVEGILELEQVSPMMLSNATRQFLLQRCEQMDPGLIAGAVEELIGSNATMVVLAGTATGAVLCLLSRVAVYFWVP